ncbi:MAG: glutathione S-transferase family protein [Gammaproteobacteria bacterium]|nr:glutathione S-transferase family protein [Gammaproteobacteria bacterium]
MKIYGDARSGNCLKVKYTADHLGLEYQWVDIDIFAGESRTPAYLANFPQGQVPGIELSDGRCLAQSNAIVRYLAAGTSLLPADMFLQAKVDEMLFWEQYSHEPYIAVCRSLMVYQGRAAADREPWRVERGEHALDLLERRPTSQRWLASDAFTVADIALLAYTRIAPEGGFDSSTRPKLRAWIKRCELELGLP